MSVLFEKVPEQAKVPGQARDDGEGASQHHSGLPSSVVPETRSAYPGSIETAIGGCFYFVAFFLRSRGKPGMTGRGVSPLLHFIVIPAKAGNQRNINTIRANTNSPTLTSQTIAFEGIKCFT